MRRSSSNFLALNKVDLGAVEIKDGLWKNRRRIIRSVSLPTQFQQLKQYGNIDNFRFAAKGNDGSFHGMRFADTDVYKWVEAASYALEKEGDRELEERVNELINLASRAQEKNGYLDTYFSLVEPNKKWTNLGMMHEMYCAGHLFEAAVAYNKATNKDTLLSVATNFADHISNTFGPNNRYGIPGHEEIELGLIALYRATKDSRYLDLSNYFVKGRGKPNSPFKDELNNLGEIAGKEYTKKYYPKLFLGDEGEYDGSYAQDHAPVTEQDKVAGHSVRAMYLYSAMVDLLLKGKEEDYFPSLEKLWKNMTKQKMYITGGVGSTAKHEGFTRNYELPNHDAYAETCASVGSVMWNYRMLRLTGNAKYADIMERALYNGVLPGVSLDGKRYFYENPLASNGDHQRQEWFECACCPPNLARLLMSLEKYIYLKRENELFINLFISSELTTNLGGTEVSFTQDSDYPWTGEISISISVKHPVEFTLSTRLPQWCDKAQLQVNGDKVDIESRLDRGYVKLNKAWSKEDRIKLDLEMPVKTISSHPEVKSNLGKVALQRGPLVYCLEETDNFSNLDQVKLPGDTNFRTEYIDGLLGGVEVIKGEVLSPKLSAWEDRLYQSSGNTEFRRKKFRAVPYYAWGNREPGKMRVWLRSENQ